MRRTRFTPLAAALLAASLLAPAAVHAQSCNCGVTGQWVGGASAPVNTTLAGYSVTAAPNGSGTQLTVTGPSGIILQLTYSTAPSWNFVEGNLLEITYGSLGTEYCTLYDLFKNGSVVASISGSSIDPYKSSPHGALVQYGVGLANTMIYHILRADSLAEIYSYQGDAPLWGPDDRTFFYYTPAGTGYTGVSLVDLELPAQSFAGSFPANWGGALYSPCGDAIAFITESQNGSITNINYELHDTKNGGAIGSQTFQQAVTLFTSATEHYAEYTDAYGVHDVHLADNGGAAACTGLPQLTGASVSPSHGVGGGTITVTGTLSGPASYGWATTGEHVTITMTSPIYGGGSFNVPWRATTGSQILQVSPVYNLPDTATITLSCNGSSRSVRYIVDPTPPVVTAFFFSPSAVDAGAPTGLFADLDRIALPGGLTIQLSSADPANLPVPASMFVAAGLNGGYVPLTAPQLLLDRSIVVHGTYGTVPLQATLNILGPRPIALASQDQACIVGGQPLHVTMNLSGAIPPAAFDVPLASSDTASVPTPAAVHVTPGTTQRTFDVATRPVASPTSVTISATFNGVTQQFIATLQPSQPFYTNLIPPIGGPSTYYFNTADAINVHGQVSGQSGPYPQAYVWTDGASVAVPGTDPGVAYTEAFALNDNGVAAGTMGSDAFVWDGATLRNLTSGSGGAALAVNGAGKVAGWENVAGVSMAFLWDGTVHLLGTLGGAASAAFGVNASSVVVGWANSGDGHTHAFRWTQLGGMTDLGLPTGATDAWATAINTGGTVVGYARAGANRACIWDAGGPRYLDASAAGQAFALNDVGQVVGVSANHPALWSGGTRTLLDALGGACGWDASVTPTGINNSGQIVGTDNSESGQFGWMLTLGAPPAADVPPAPREAVRALGLSVLGANPVRGALALRCALPELGPARLELLDVTGRRVSARALPGEGAVQFVRLEESVAWAPGIYFARLTQAGHTLLARVALVR